MQISNVMILRDGGTILFEIFDDALEGKYRLQTPFAGTPQPLFRDELKLEVGSVMESEIAAKLRLWLTEKLTPDLKQRIAELDELKVWRNISRRLEEAVPFHRIRWVLQVLESRPPSDGRWSQAT
jgi:hypothetical protein